MADMVDHAIVLDDVHYGRVEDAQMTILHMLCYVSQTPMNQLTRYSVFWPIRNSSCAPVASPVRKSLSSSPSGQLVQRCQFLGKDEGVALGHDQDAGSKPECWRSSCCKTQPDEWIRNWRFRFSGNLAVFRVGVLGIDSIRHDDVFAAPDRFKSSGFCATANFQ